MTSRRLVLQIGGLMLADLALRVPAAGAAVAVEIGMVGNADGSVVRFEPAGVLVEPGQEIRWVNRDAGNSHTTTAYHPGNRGRPLRIPQGAKSWDSDYLLPEQVFSLRLDVPGVYDYFCRPHEQCRHGRPDPRRRP